MSMYYIKFNVAPTLENQFYKEVEGALLSCWVVEDEPQSAFAKAAFSARRDNWEILQIEDPPMVVTLEDFAERDIGIEQFHAAEKSGISTAYVAWARDGVTSRGPVRVSGSKPINLEAYLSRIKKLKLKGRCLHFDAGSRCAKVIDAHSIQKRGVLSLIAESGQVFAPSRDFGDVKRNLGKIAFSQQGISAVSTFRGFCATHDNEVFAPIDKAPILPTNEQVLLYAYRAICRELFIKENSLTFFSEQTRMVPEKSVLSELFDGLRVGTELGLKNLQHHKRLVDQCIKQQSFSEIRYVMFCSKENPNTVFSGVIFPDFDFLGHQLQDLADHTRIADLLSISFVPLGEGWGFLFAWHSACSDTCIPFMESLATVIHGKGDTGEFLFRFVIAGCENLAVNPTWWKSLQVEEQNAIQSTASNGPDLFKLQSADYLAAGLGNVANWKFEKVISQMEPEI